MPPNLGLQPGEFVIRTWLTNNFLTARDSGHHSIDALITSATTLGPNEKFKLTTILPYYTSIQTLQDYYVSANQGGGNHPGDQVLQTETLSVIDQALFRVTLSTGLDGHFDIRTVNGYYLTAVEGGGQASHAFQTDQIRSDDWEWFSVLKSGDLGSGYTYAIRPAGTGIHQATGETISYLTAIGGGGNPTYGMAPWPGLSQESSGFTLIRQIDDGTYALRTSNGRNVVTAVGGGGVSPQHDNLHTDATTVGAWERFRFMDQGDATYAIQTNSGWYLGVNPSIQTAAGISTRLSDPNDTPSGFTARFELIMIGV
jgi:hypothetical protein